MMLNQEQVVQYLREHPDFFTEHAELLAVLKVPHPYSGQTISLGERQVMLLRERARNLEAKLREFIQFAEENDAIGEKLHKLALQLMRARSLKAVFEALNYSLREEFAIPHTCLRIWGSAVDPELAEFTPVSDAIRQMTSELTSPRCGHEVPDEVRGWFGDIGEHLRSFALAPLRDRGVAGLLILASEEPTRFYPEMGTLYLNWLAELAGAAISRYVDQITGPGASS